MESLFIWKMDSYDWFCGPGSQLWFDINYINSTLISLSFRTLNHGFMYSSTQHEEVIFKYIKFLFQFFSWRDPFKIITLIIWPFKNGVCPYDEGWQRVRYEIQLSPAHRHNTSAEVSQAIIAPIVPASQTMKARSLWGCASRGRE